MKIYWSEEQGDYVFQSEKWDDMVFLLIDYYDPGYFIWEGINPYKLELVAEVTDE